MDLILNNNYRSRFNNLWIRKGDMKKSEVIELYDILTPYKLRGGLGETTKKDWEDAYYSLFNFTLGLYTGSKLNEKTIKKLLKIK